MSAILMSDGKEPEVDLVVTNVGERTAVVHTAQLRIGRVWVKKVDGAPMTSSIAFCSCRDRDRTYPISLLSAAGIAAEPTDRLASPSRGDSAKPRVKEAASGSIKTSMSRSIAPNEVDRFALKLRLPPLSAWYSDPEIIVLAEVTLYFDESDQKVSSGNLLFSAQPDAADDAASIVSLDQMMFVHPVDLREIGALEAKRSPSMEKFIEQSR